MYKQRPNPKIFYAFNAHFSLERKRELLLTANIAHKLIKNQPSTLMILQATKDINETTNWTKSKRRKKAIQIIIWTADGTEGSSQWKKKERKMNFIRFGGLK